MLLALAMATPTCAGARTADGCPATDASKVKTLFVRWNEALRDVAPAKVLALHANGATLLPAVGNGPYTKTGGMKEYFLHFVAREPAATIDDATRVIKLGCNVAYDIGLYSFAVNAAHPPERETIWARYTFIYK